MEASLFNRLGLFLNTGVFEADNEAVGPGDDVTEDIEEDEIDRNNCIIVLVSLVVEAGVIVVDVFEFTSFIAINGIVNLRISSAMGGGDMTVGDIGLR